MALAVEHAKERQAFGRPISEFQAVSHRIAEMATRTEAARLLVYAAADAYDDGEKTGLTAKAAMAKLAATETAQYVVDGAIQILGARALEEAHPLSHLYREVRAPSHLRGHLRDPEKRDREVGSGCQAEPRRETEGGRRK